MPLTPQSSGDDSSALDMFLRVAVGLQLLVVILGCAMSTSATMYTYDEATGESIDAVCKDSIGSDGARWLDSACGTKVMNYTGQAACEAGDGFGCGLAASLAGSDEGLSQSLREGGSAENTSQQSQKLASRGCSLDDQLSCLIQFTALAQSGSRGDIQRAIRLGDRKCSEEMPLICQSMGAAFENGARTAADRRKAVEYYRTACDADFPPGCRKLGKMYADGFGVSSNQTRADKFYGKACKLGDEQACDKIGDQPPESNEGTDTEEMFVESMGITNKDMFEMAKTGCNNGFPPACTYFGRVVERGEVRGRYVGMNQAVALYELGCNKGASRSCYRLASHISRTDGSISGTDQALGYARKACDESVDGACDLRRDLQARQITKAASFESYATQCESGTDSNETADQTAEASSEGASSDPEQASAAADPNGDTSPNETDETEGGDDSADDGAAIEVGRAGACQIAAIGYTNGQVVDQDLERAVSLYRQGCQLDHATACWRAGDLLQTHEALKADASSINTLYEQGCDGGAMAACDQLGRRLAGDFADAEAGDDDGGTTDVERAKGYLETACDARYGKACARLATILENQAASAESDDQSLDMEARRESLLQRGCATGHVPSCRRLGVFYLDRAQTGEEYRQAFKMLYIGCRQDDADACAYLGINEVDFDDAELRDEGQKHLETACIGGSGLGCRGLGDGYYNGSFVEKDREKSAELYGQACTNGSGAGCVMLARQYEAGDGVEFDPAKARDKYRAGCDAEYGEGCQGLADMYLYGASTAYDLDKGESFLQKGCNMGHDQSCFQLEQLHTSGVHKEPSFVAARKALETGCQADSVTACDRVANYYYLGIGTEQDAEAGDKRAARVNELLKRQCETYGIASVCARWAHHMAHGRGTDTDNPRARNFLEKRCKDNKGGRACLEIADLRARGHIYEHNRVAAMEKLRSQCDEDNLAACSMAAYFKMHGRDPDLAPEEAVSHYRSECDGDDSRACTRLARAYLTGFGARREPRRAVRLLEPMCRPGNEDECIAYTTGLIGMEADDRASGRLERSLKACENRHAPHCVVAGKLYAAGIGTARDLARAESKFEQACDEGLIYACPSTELIRSFMAQQKAGKAGRAAKRCESGNLKACVVAGVAAQYGIGRSRSLDEAAGFYDTACQNQESLGCAARLSMHAFNEQNLSGDAYFTYADRSCEARSADFCYRLSQQTAPFEWEPAVELATKACKRGENRACIWLVDRGVAPPESD